MKCIGFIGKIDKTELIEYIAKTISAMGKKVIMIDATLTQKTRYCVPSLEGIGSEGQYVVQYDGVDVAIGFSNMLELKKFLLSKGEDFNEYDYALVDTDLEDMIDEYDLKSANKLFFVSSYDKLYIHKGVDLLKYTCALKRRADPEGKLDLTKILYYSDINTADAKYIDRVAENLPIVWRDEHIDFPYDQGDLSVNIRNQYANKIDMRYLTKMYKEAVAKTVEIITEESIASIKKVIKNIEKSARFAV